MKASMVSTRLLPIMALVAGYSASKYYLSLQRQISFKGKVVIITGGSRGLGLLMAREIARQGGKVAICARNANELDKARDWLSKEGAGDVDRLVCDVSVREQVENMVSAVKNRHGTIDILINNAGVIEIAPIEHMGIEDFKEAMDTIFWGSLYPSLAVLGHMREKNSGQIVNITSIGGILALPHMIPYSSAKFAVVGLSQGLHAELKSSGIKVTTIVPGLMRTGSYINAKIKGQKEKEFTWFALGDALPGISMDAERAVHQILKAVRRKQAYKIIGMPAKVAAFLNGNMPGVVSEVLSTVSDFLPKADDSTSDSQIPVKGQEVNTLEKKSPLKTISKLGRDAVKRYQSYQ